MGFYEIKNDSNKNYSSLCEIINERGLSGVDVLDLLTDWHGLQLCSREFCENLRDCEGFYEFKD